MNCDLIRLIAYIYTKIFPMKKKSRKFNFSKINLVKENDLIFHHLKRKERRRQEKDKSSSSSSSKGKGDLN